VLVWSRYVPIAYKFCKEIREKKLIGFIRLRIETKLIQEAKQARLQNFYNYKTKKLNATTFYTIKHKEGSHDIKFYIMKAKT
jgi:hypothetical protein